MTTHGHYLFQLLQQGKYFAATRDGVAYDYWDELPAQRRAQYEDAAREMMKRGANLVDSGIGRDFDPEAPTMVPPPRKP